MPRRSRRQDAAGGRPDRPSKSQRKRESTALQALGVALADAPPAALAAATHRSDCRRAGLARRRLNGDRGGDECLR